MYTAVLVLSLTVSADATACHWGNRCGCSGISYGCYGGGSYGASYGGCYGGGYYGASYGGCYGSGSYGGIGYQPYGGYYGGQGYNVQPGKTPEKIGEPKKKDPGKEPVPGTLVINLPANAKLTIDEYVSQQSSPQRLLVTPPIPPGQEFSYTLVAEIVQNGQPVRQTQTVTVRGGQQRPVNFNFAAVPAAAR